MKTLYPPIEPYATHLVAVDHGHRLYVEECGNPDGLPVLYLHGGPGSGCRPHHRSFFDPARYRAILLDQRGSGRSTPMGELQANTTRHLLDDVETVRRLLGVERWLLFGGSWGATLALLYAQRYPQRVSGLVLRGSFLARPCDLDWFLAQGAGRIYPEAWQKLMDFIPENRRAAAVDYLHELLTGADQLAQRRAAGAWLHWAGQVTLAEAFDAERLGRHLSAEQIHKAGIELRYAVHRYFLEDRPILDGCAALAAIPASIVHGRNDLVCPPEAAFALQRALPHAQLRILPGAGHIAEGEIMIDALVDAADRMLGRLAS